jgi:hypothetical protein
MRLSFTRSRGVAPFLFAITVVAIALSTQFPTARRSAVLVADAADCDWAKDPLSNQCRRRSLEALITVASMLKVGVKSSRNPIQFGKGYGMHALIDTGKPNSTCVFYSYGIARDYSFDTHLARAWECKGFLFDPSVVHPALLPASLHFFHLAAPLLSDAPDLAEWIAVSPPQVMSFFKHRHLHVLKMDCEGCEYALARDIAAFDPAFFTKVDQFALEVHASRFWAKSELHEHYLGLLYHMLFAAGFALEDGHVGGCGPATEVLGCPATMQKVGYPCGINKSCHNYLFAKR